MFRVSFVRGVLGSVLAATLAFTLGCAAEDDDKKSVSWDQDVSSGSDSDTQSDSLPDQDFDTDDIVLPSEGCQRIDILFVIDDSGSMSEEQNNLVYSFPKFVEVLDEFEPEPGAHVPYRIGVTTTSVNRSFTVRDNIPGFPPLTNPVTTKGPDGAFVHGESCGLPEPWMSGPGDEVSDQFSCVGGKVGVTGVGYEMPLAAMKLALGSQLAPGGANEGFYSREDNSLLAVVMITDEDDCSVESGGVLVRDASGNSDCSSDKSKGIYDLDEAKGFLDDLTGGEGRYVAVAIAGPGPKSCSSSFGDAVFAERIKKFIDLVGAYGVFGNICSGDMWTSLQEALSVMTVACRGLPPK